MAPAPIEIPLGDLTFDALADGPADGAPVLLLHGFPESSWTWRHVQPALATAGYRTIAPDQRGYSPRARPADPSAYAMETLVADALAFADSQDWDTFHLVGHDWGGAVAWHVAGRHPERLRTLSVVSTPHPIAFQAAKDAGPSADGDDQAARSSYIQFFREPGAEELFLAEGGAAFRMALDATGMAQKSIDRYLAALSTPEAVIGALNWYRGADVTDSNGLGPITTPTLYVWSTGDTALGRTAAEGTAAHVDGPYRFEVLPDVSHWIPEAAPDRLTAFLLAHLGDG
ncbi:MAG TPA: alpha/beta hydrolase [Acidimicrobiales bacterium]|jgi:pimeloyl-ACP methyl ester carboxylesterase